MHRITNASLAFMAKAIIRAPMSIPGALRANLSIIESYFVSGYIIG